MDTNLVRTSRIAILGIGLAMAGTALADGDSDADAAGGFTAVQHSTGVIIRVPTNASGQEYVGGAEMRIYDERSVNTSSDMARIFTGSHDVSVQPHVTASDIQRDSDTRGWFGGYAGYHPGYSNYYGYYGASGWQSPYYFYNYQPSYYYGGSYYNYGSPYYANYYGGAGSYSYYGYRYYCYPRYW